MQNVIGASCLCPIDKFSQLSIDLSLIRQGTRRLCSCLKEIDHIKIEMDICTHLDVVWFLGVASYFGTPAARHDPCLRGGLKRNLSCSLHKTFAISAPQSAHELHGSNYAPPA